MDEAELDAKIERQDREYAAKLYRKVATVNERGEWEHPHMMANFRRIYGW